jgi:cytochrome c biogenesis protein CcdA/thiol-disulfide isomerase/thioredoxin
MLLLLLAYVGGILTIVSPCILPVLPFVFVRADQPFIRAGLPMLVGMALTFAAVATLAAVGGGWVVAANQYGRWLAMVLLAFFGIVLMAPHLAARLTRPLVALGARLSGSAESSEVRGRSPIYSSLLLGIAIGLLWAPCAGPVLGLILTGAALGGASAQTTLLLAAYAAGAATSLALALLVGGRVFAWMKRLLGVGEWVRRGLGAAVLLAVVAIGLGLDTGLLTRLSSHDTAALEQSLLDKFGFSHDVAAPPTLRRDNAGTLTRHDNLETTVQTKPPLASKDAALPIEGQLPSLSGAATWLNSPPLTVEQLKGKVVLIDFWTYSCINCLRTLPYVQAWAAKYQNAGLVVIGVHAPEFAFEKSIDNVKRAVANFKITYPVAIDNDYAIWRGFNNHYWPAHYFIDAAGRIRAHHFGEGGYEEAEKVIQQLLVEAGNTLPGVDPVTVKAAGIEAAARVDDIESPETYIGYQRAENFLSERGFVQDAAHNYQVGKLRTNEWGLNGNWTIGAELAVLNQPNGSIVYRFHARDLHLVLGSANQNKPIRFRVTIDGQAPGASHGMDVDANGLGSVTGERLYQLIRQHGAITDRTFEIQFLDPGVQAYAFTFG